MTRETAQKVIRHGLKRENCRKAGPQNGLEQKKMKKRMPLLYKEFELKRETGVCQMACMWSGII